MSIYYLYRHRLSIVVENCYCLLVLLWRGAGIRVGIKRGSLVAQFYEFEKLVKFA